MFALNYVKSNLADVLQYFLVLWVNHDSIIGKRIMSGAKKMRCVGPALCSKICQSNPITK